MVNKLLISVILFVAAIFEIESSCSQYNDANINLVVILDEGVQSLCSESSQRDEILQEDIINVTTTCSNLGLKIFSECGHSRSEEIEIYSRIFKMGDNYSDNFSTFCVKDEVKTTIVVSESNLTTPHSSDLILVTVSPFENSASNVINIAINETERIQELFTKLVELDWDYISLIVTEEYYNAYSVLISSELNRTRVCTRSTTENPIIIYNHQTSVSQIHPHTTGVVYIGDDLTGVDLYERWGKCTNIWVMTVHPKSFASQPSSPELLLISPDLAKRDVIMSVVNSIAKNCDKSLLEIRGELTNLEPRELKWTPENTDSLKSRSLCKYSCSDYCFDLLRREQRYMYIHGDYILLITAPITSKPRDDQWVCSQSVNATSGWEMISRSVHAQVALEMINEHLKIDHSPSYHDFFSMGMVLVNTCYGGQRTNYILQQVLSGELEIKSMDGFILDPKKIIMILSDYSSNTATQAHDYAVWNNLLQIGWGAATPILDDTSLYPNIFRINPSDSHTITYMADVLTKLNEIGNDIKRVNIFYSDNVYGRNALELKKQVEDRGFQVSHLVPLYKKNKESMSDDEWKATDDFQTWLRYLRADDTRVHLIYSDLDHYFSLLDELIKDSNKHKWQKTERAFIFDTSWGRRNAYAYTYGSITRGSMSLAVDLNFECAVDNFHGFFTLNPYRLTAERENPWLNMIWSLKAACKPRGEFFKDYPSDAHSCSHADWGKIPKEFDAQEMWALMLMKSMFAASKAFQSYLIDACDQFKISGLPSDCAKKLIQLREEGEELKQLKIFLSATKLGDKCDIAMKSHNAQQQKVFTNQTASRWEMVVYQQQFDCGSSTRSSTYVPFLICSSDRPNDRCQLNSSMTGCTFYYGISSCDNKGCIIDIGTNPGDREVTPKDGYLPLYVIIGVLIFIIVVITTAYFARKSLLKPSIHCRETPTEGNYGGTSCSEGAYEPNDYALPGSNNAAINGGKTCAKGVYQVTDYAVAGSNNAAFNGAFQRPALTSPTSTASSARAENSTKSLSLVRSVCTRSAP